jgi:uncharacterized RDD family membrane protein YckC
MAGLIDVAAVAGAVLAMALIFHFAGGRFVFTRTTLPLFVIAPLLVYALYEVLWAAGNTDTPGMRITGLRVLDFDGNSPDAPLRLRRVGAFCLSAMAAGVGLLWALGDQESLAWHDHMSNTFPTYAEEAGD